MPSAPVATHTVVCVTCQRRVDAATPRVGAGLRVLRHKNAAGTELCRGSWRRVDALTAVAVTEPARAEG